MSKNGLIPNTERTPSELREITRKGGIASGKSRRLKRSMREAAMTLLEGKVKIDKLPKNLKEVASLIPDKERKKANWQAMVMMGQLIAAINGDPRAAKFITDLLGETTAQAEELNKVDKILAGLDELMSHD